MATSRFESCPDRKRRVGQRKGKHDIYRIARQCGVRLYNGSRQYNCSRGIRECFSTATLRKIANLHGEAHLALVLRLIVETEGNAAELYSETILAISALLEHYPDLLERGGSLFDCFDRIDLKGIRDRAREKPCGLPVGHVMRILIMQEIETLAAPCN